MVGKSTEISLFFFPISKYDIFVDWYDIFVDWQPMCQARFTVLKTQENEKFIGKCYSFYD